MASRIVHWFRQLVDKVNLLETAPELGWRFFVHRGNVIVAAIESRRTEGGGYRAGPITEGPFVDGTERAFLKAADESENLNRSC